MQLLDRCCGHKVRRYEAVLLTAAPGHVKYAKDKVEVSNFILQGLCDMVKVGLLKLFINCGRQEDYGAMDYITLHYI